MIELSEEQRLQLVSEYIGLSDFVIEKLIKLDDKQKRAVSIVIMAIEHILGEKKNNEREEC